MGFSKIVLVGGGATGKTTFSHRALTGKLLLEKYTPTIGVEVHKVRVDGREFIIWDMAGKPKYQGMGAELYLCSDGCIAFYSSNRALTDKYVADFLNQNPNAPVVYVWNGCDLARERECADALGFEGPKISSFEADDWKIPFRLLIK